MSFNEIKSAPVLRAVVKSDTAELKVTLDDGAVMWPRALWVGGAGNVSVLAAGDKDPVTLVGVEAGTVLDIKARKVTAATTATDIVAMY